MRRIGLFVLSVGVFGFTAVVGPGARGQAEAPSPEVERVVGALVEDWAQHMHSTDIAMAMANLGMEPDDELRLAVGETLRSNVHLASNLRWWGANNYILSAEEKRVVKALSGFRERGARVPTAGALAAAAEVDPSRLAGRLAFMARAGVLTASAGSELGYELVPKYASWGGPLRFNYHHVTVGDAKPFGVW